MPLVSVGNLCYNLAKTAAIRSDILCRNWFFKANQIGTLPSLLNFHLYLKLPTNPRYLVSDND